jgi:hypothetical protein
MSKSIELPGGGPSLNELVEGSETDRLRLDTWGFVRPYDGTRVGAQATGDLFCWAGSLNDHNEAAVLAAVVDHRQDLGSASWFYGVVQSQDLDRAADPIEAVVEAAQYRYHEYGNNHQSFYWALQGLITLMPIHDQPG